MRLKRDVNFVNHPGTGNIKSESGVSKTPGNQLKRPDAPGDGVAGASIGRALIRRFFFKCRVPGLNLAGANQMLELGKEEKKTQHLFP